jgi:hypothetical protein
MLESASLDVVDRDRRGWKRGSVSGTFDRLTLPQCKWRMIDIGERPGLSAASNSGVSEPDRKIERQKAKV